MSSNYSNISNDAKRMLEEADNSPVAFLSIKQSYSFNDSGKVIIVVEGADDELFYLKPVKQFLGVDSLVVARAGNKKQVYATYEAMDWTLYRRDRVLFFVDRDYDEIVCESSHVRASNLYVTDCYAIENYVCTEDSFLRLCSYVCGGSGLSRDDELLVRRLYSDAVSVFETVLSNVPETLIAWRRLGLKPNQANINLRCLMKVDKGVATQCDDHALALIAKQCGVSSDDAAVSDEDLYDIGERLHCYGGFCGKMSGKVLRQFFNMLASSMQGYRFPSGAKVTRSGLLAPDVFPLCVAFADCPRSLIDFLLDARTHLECEAV